MENCVCFNIRRFSRAFTHFYAAELNQHGLLPTQTPILGALAMNPEASMAQLSEWLLMDRTTLLRNLRPLERDGLVQAIGKGRGNKVSLTLTSKGRSTLEQFIPDWQKTHAKVIKVLGQERWDAILADLERATQALKN